MRKSYDAILLHMIRPLYWAPTIMRHENESTDILTEALHLHVNIFQQVVLALESVMS